MGRMAPFWPAPLQAVAAKRQTPHASDARGGQMCCCGASTHADRRRGAGHSQPQAPASVHTRGERCVGQCPSAVFRELDIKNHGLMMAARVFGTRGPIALFLRTRCDAQKRPPEATAVGRAVRACPLHGSVQSTALNAPWCLRRPPGLPHGRPRSQFGSMARSRRQGVPARPPSFLRAMNEPRASFGGQRRLQTPTTMRPPGSHWPDASMTGTQ